MFSNLQINRSLARKPAMERSGKVLSDAFLQNEWVEIQAAQTDPAAFAPLYERYYEPIFRFIYKRCGSEDLSGDLCAQVFLQALQKLPSYVFKGVPFSAWLFRIAINELAQYFRKQSKQRTVSFEDADLPELFAGTLEEGSDILDHLPKVLEILDQLKTKDMLLIEMRFFEHRPYKEISEILEISVSNAKVRVHRLLDRIQKKINA